MYTSPTATICKTALSMFVNLWSSYLSHDAFAPFQSRFHRIALALTLFHKHRRTNTRRPKITLTLVELNTKRKEEKLFSLNGIVTEIYLVWQCFPATAMNYQVSDWVMKILHTSDLNGHSSIFLIKPQHSLLSWRDWLFCLIVDQYTSLAQKS